MVPDIQKWEGKAPTLSLVLVAYNEEGNIEQTVVGLQTILKEANVDYHLILVNNGSNDATEDIAKRLAEEDPRLSVISIEVNQGYGWGVICGLDHVSDGFAGYMGSDGQVDPRDVVEILRLVETGHCDLAKAKRITRGDGFIRRSLSLCYNSLVSLVFPVSTNDVNAVPKIFRSELVNKLDLRSKDWFIDTELMIKAGDLKLRIEEHPVIFHARQAGNSHVKVRIVWDLLWDVLAFKVKGGSDG